MNTAEIDELFSRGVASFIDPDGTFRNKIEAKIKGESAKDIVIKFGVDPTRPDIHIGHAVVLRKLRNLQDIGCKVIFLIGDYTSQIGDPTGKSKIRPEITQAEIEANMKTYLDQVGKILRTDEKVFSWIRNSDWFLNVTDIEPKQGGFVRVGVTPVAASSFVGKAVFYENTRMQKTHLKMQNIGTVSLTRVLSVLRHITHARLIERDMFQDRLKNGGELYMHEMLYPVLQGIDSTVLASIYGSCDLEIGGSDQTFNMLMGRDVMKMNNQPQQAVLSMDILEGLDGKEKMSKSLENYVSIADEPNNMYGKIMSLPDALITRYFHLATPVTESEIAEMEKGLKENTVHPRDAKMRLARTITATYYGEKIAMSAQDAFFDTFSQGKIPENVTEISAAEKTTIIDAIMDAECASSRAEARRLVEAGAVTHLESDSKISDAAAHPVPGTYRVGKIRFFKIK
jgi:tyrosyl-tRNA synthetase